ncbi:cellulase family glycosylhydrolase [Saccharothrix texasensis]|uniref:Endoglucanase n=1 Tax=Saccharothrix texasensis TaxID=103734 RepID=A0A3N1HHK5_9PSEU|nr:cellulase family glycosylhydrolase [Saccharothrix texasensis]ROP41802.1 mannan endo-1,4-beta-mannosidase [Saccharothrix texasensis]
MFRRWAMVAAVALTAAVVPLVTAPAASAANGFYVSGGRLYDANGNDFVLRGVNHAHTWYTDKTTQAMKDIKALGANSIRVVLGSGDRWTKNDASDVANIVSQCKANKLICVLEVHDTTGYGEDGAAASLAKAANYWLSIKSAIVGQEKYVIVNIGNEPYGNTNYGNWVNDTKSAIQTLRSGGLTHTLMVDAPNWGQDWSGTMRDNASSVFGADSLKNTVFSIHMYGVYDTSSEISSYLNTFVSAKLPILVGEFGNNHSDGNPDEDSIMSITQSLKLGYMGWSWSGNGGGVEYLDMANSFNASSLSSWGQRFFNGSNGIKATSKEASVYGGGGGDPNDTTPPSTPGTPSASNVASSGVSLSWSASSDNVGVSSYQVVRVNSSSETTVASPSTNSASISGLSASTSYTFAVYALDAAGNRSSRSSTVTVTTLSGGGNGGGSCDVTYRVSQSWNGGFQGEVAIKNTSSSAVNGWTLVWSFSNGQTVTQMWHALASQSGSQVSARNETWNPVIGAGGSVSLGFTGSYNGTNSAPTAFTLNGATCSVS